MKCHKKFIDRAWLKDQQEDYYQYLFDAFKMVAMREFSNSLKGKQREQQDHEIQQIAEFDLVKEEENYRDLIISTEQALASQVIYKRGGTFGSIERRNAKFEKTILNQIINDHKSKIIGEPTSFVILTKDDADKKFPWDEGNQQYEARIIMLFQNHTPIWIYCKDQNAASRIRNYFLCHKIINQNAIGNQEKSVNESQQNGKNKKINEKIDIIATCNKTRDLYKIQAAVLFEKALDKFSGVYAEQKRKAAQLASTEKQFLQKMEETIMRNVLVKKWLKVSLNLKEREDQMKLMEDAERQKLLMVQQQQERTKVGWSKFLESKEMMYIDSGEQLRKFVSEWQERAEEIMYKQQVKNLTFGLQFKSLNVDESIYLIKPILQIDLQTNQQMNDNQSKSSKYMDDSKTFFRIKLEAFLAQQRTDNFYNWALKEIIFENFDSAEKLGKIERKACAINISNLLPSDYLKISFQDMVNAFYDTVTDQYSVNVKELLQNSEQGRSVWIPLRMTQKNPKTGEQKVSMIYLELDIHVSPCILSSELINFEQELDYICLNDQPFLDPIYEGMISIPKLNDEIVKVLIAIIEQNTICMKQSLYMLSYMIFVSTQNTSKKQNFQKLKVYSIRRIIENLCMNFGYFLQQVEVFRQIEEKFQNYNIFNIKNLLSQQVIREFLIKGVPYHVRTRVWFSWLKIDVEVIYPSLRHFKVYPEQRLTHQEQQEGKIVPITIWVYSKIVREKANTPKHYLHAVDKFLRSEDQRKGIVNESFYHMLKNVLSAFCLYLSLQKIVPLDKYLQHIFTIAKKLLSMHNFHFIQYIPFQGVVQDGMEDQEYQSQQMIEVKRESNTFWLLIGFCNQILNDYPFFENNQSQRIFLEDCANLRVYLNRNHPTIKNQLFLLGIDLENSLSECFFNLFSDLFPSEILYRVWDLIIFNQLNSLIVDVERGYVLTAVLAVLIVKLEPNLHLISEHMNFLSALKLQAQLIRNFDELALDILEMIKNIAKSVKTERDEEGPIQLGQIDDSRQRHHMRILDILEEKKPKGSQQMHVYQYLSHIDY